MGDVERLSRIHQRPPFGKVAVLCGFKIGGCLAGIGLLAVPGIGPLVAVGTAGTALAATIAGAGIGAASGGLIEVLAGSGISSEEARDYSDRLSRGEYLVMVEGTDEQVLRAEYEVSSSKI